MGAILLYLRLHSTLFRHKLLLIGTWVHFHVGTFTDGWLNLPIQFEAYVLAIATWNSIRSWPP